MYTISYDYSIKNSLQWTVVALLILICSTINAQQTDTLRLASIPAGLFWENLPKSYSIKRGELTIVAGKKSDMFRDPNVTYNTDNAPKLLFEAAQNFVLTTAIEHSFINKWDGGAIVIKQDNLNWIKFCFEKDYTGAKRVVSVVTKEISDDCNSVEVNANKIFYKVAKADNVFTLYYSSEGTKWFLVRHFQFNTTGKIHIGFLAQSPTGDKCEVKFTAIHYEAKKIKDPYLGE